MKKLCTWFIVLGGMCLFVIIPSYVSAATLSATTSAGSSITTGVIFPVVINLSTQGADIQGVDLHYLNYDPTALEVQDENSAITGVQIAPGSLMVNTVANSVNTTAGQVNFSQITSGGQTYNGSGVLATVRFKALRATTTSLTINHTLGNTTDSNIASNGQDLLTEASGLSLTLSGSSVPTATPAPAPPPSSGGGGGGGGGGGIPPIATQTPIATATTSAPVITPAGTPIYETNPPAGSSTGPVVIRRLAESTPDGIRIPEGGSASGGIIVFTAQLFDANNNRVKLEVELRRKEESYTETPTIMSNYVNPGETARVERGGLIPGEYKFRARASNIKLEKSEWLEFGNSSATDFIMRVGTGGGLIATPTPVPGSRRKPYAFTRTLRRGTKGADVTALQNMLQELGYDTGTIDGWYGLKALNAIKKFQAKEGLGADGVFGPKSQGRFNLVYAGTSPLPEAPTTQFARTLRRGMRGDDVKALQEKLNKLGFSVGTADGSFGAKTFVQVKAFQSQYNLGSDGVAGPKTLQKLDALGR